MSVDVAQPRARRLTSLQRWGAVALATLAVLLIDQLSKAWALRDLDPGEAVHAVWTLQFNLAFNSGMAFSKGAGAGPIIGLIAIVIAVVLIFVARRVTSVLQLVLIGVVIGGALGNVIDRLTRVGEVNPFTGRVATGFMGGSVVDFIDLQWWPIFNVADAAICVGGIGLALTSLRVPDDESEDADQAEAAAPTDEAQEHTPDDVGVTEDATVDNLTVEAASVDGVPADRAPSDD